MGDSSFWQNVTYEFLLNGGKPRFYYFKDDSGTETGPHLWEEIRCYFDDIKIPILCIRKAQEMVKKGDGEELRILEKCFLGQDTNKIDYAKDFDVEKSSAPDCTIKIYESRV